MNGFMLPLAMLSGASQTGLVVKLGQYLELILGHCKFERNNIPVTTTGCASAQTSV